MNSVAIYATNICWASTSCQALCKVAGYTCHSSCHMGKSPGGREVSWNASICTFISFVVCVCVCVCFLGPYPRQYGSSQARGPIRIVAAQSQSCQIWATCPTYTIVHGNPRSLIHWAGSGIKAASSWMLLRFVSAEPLHELHLFIYF